MRKGNYDMEDLMTTVRLINDIVRYGYEHKENMETIICQLAGRLDQEDLALVGHLLADVATQKTETGWPKGAI